MARHAGHATDDEGNRTGMSQPLLKISDLHAVIAEDGTEILKGVDLAIEAGRVHAIMGPNGSGKSTLSKVLAGHPAYEVTEGEVLFKGRNLLELGVDERARDGLFLAFQYPVDIPGVSIANFLRAAMQARQSEPVDIFDFQEELLDRMKLLEMDPAFASRSVNDGFSGGEKKRNEILQMALLRPELSIMDETDSGLDIDALRIVSEGVNRLHAQRPESTYLLITHYQRILNYIKPDVVHVMVNGRIVETGGPELAERLEAHGYEEWREEPAAPVA